MVRWVVGSNLHDGPIVPTSAVVCDILSVDGAYKRSLSANRKSSPLNGGSGFPLRISPWSFTIIMSDTI